MKICINCNEPVAASWECSACGFSPALKEKFPEFAPLLEGKHEGFPPDRYPVLAETESRDFWFRSRNKMIIWALNTYFDKFKNFLEIGCGTGYVLSGIARQFPGREYWASEIDPAGLPFVQSKLPQANLFQMDARHIPFKEEFDVIGAFDVIEHIEEDEAVLGQMHKAVRPGGGVLITVPQHPSLWSYRDEYSHHKRRYTRKELVRKLETVGFGVRRVVSFVSLLAPLMMLSRLSQKDPDQFNPDEEHRLPAFLNSMFEKTMDFERTLINMGITFPFGGSLLCVAFKK